MFCRHLDQRRSGRNLAVARRPLDGRTPRRPPTICYVRSTSTRDIRPLAAGVRVASNHRVEGMLLSSLSIVPSFTELGARELSPRGCREAATEAPLYRCVGPSNGAPWDRSSRFQAQAEASLDTQFDNDRSGLCFPSYERIQPPAAPGRPSRRRFMRWRTRARPLMGEPDQAGSGALPVDPRRKKAAAAAADPYLRG